MKRAAVIVSTLFLVALLAAVGYRLFTPKVGHATRAEIEAVLPPSLKVEDPPDPAGEARFRSLVEVASSLDTSATKESDQGADATVSFNEKIFPKMERLLAKGSLRTPKRKVNAPMTDGLTFKDAGKAICLAAQAAGKRGDRASCARWLRLELRFSSAIERSGGVVIDALIAMAIDATAVRTAYVAEIDGELDEAGRESILPLLSPQIDAANEMADAVRRDFQQYDLPALIDPQSHLKEMVESVYPSGTSASGASDRSTFGSFEPVQTARLAGAIYDALIADLRRPYWQARHGESSIIAAAEKGLPTPPLTSDGELEGGWDGIKYRAAMNMGSNTLGRMFVADGVLSNMGQAVVHNAANRNLVRAAFLLRMDRSVDVKDPFNGKPLKIDRQSKVVWTVGTNGRDDGGQIGRGGDNQAPDLGYPYGNHSYRPNPNGPFRTEPRGMPPSP